MQRAAKICPNTGITFYFTQTKKEIWNHYNLYKIPKVYFKRLLKPLLCKCFENVNIPTIIISYSNLYYNPCVVTCFNDLKI